MDIKETRDDIKPILPFYKRIWEWWKPVAHKIGNFQARLILTVFYFTLFAPFALIVKLATDPLRLKSKTPKGWVEREDKPVEDPLVGARRQS